MPYSQTNGLRIYYETYGEGPPLVLIHANPFDHRLFLYQIAHFSAFHRVIAMDLRGYGRSDKPETPFTLSDLTQDVLGVLADLDITRAIFIGVSVGSGIAMQIALDHPSMVRGSILVGGSSRGPRNIEEILRGFVDLDLKTYLDILMRRYTAPGFADSAIGRFVLNLFVEKVDSLSPHAIAQVFRARASFDMSARLDSITQPTLVINGELDGSLPAGMETASLIPGARHAIITDAGHACCIEQPEAFDRVVLDFIKGLPD